MSEYQKQWRFHPSARKELDDLPVNAQQGIAELMARLRRDEELLPREADNYGKGLRGLKYSEAHNEFRCYYGHQGKFGQVLLAVGFAYKKNEKADLKTARERLVAWEAEGKSRQATAKKRK
jgi:phage-related protein